MTRHYNPSIVERANRILNSKAGDFLSDEVAGPVATIALEPVCRVIANATAASTGSTTIYTTPTSKDFYLTSLQLYATTDATADNNQYAIFVTIDGVQVNILQMVKQLATAWSDHAELVFKYPMKLDRGSLIRVNTSYTVGNSRHGGCVHGFTEEVTKT